MKVPYPTISSKLAYQSHMYICYKKEDTDYKFLKCQTLKPYMLDNTPIKNFIDEIPNKLRNPFKKTTRIDCDKSFNTLNVEYSVELLTEIRKDISKDVHNTINAMIDYNNISIIKVNEDELVSINKYIKFIKSF